MDAWIGVAPTVFLSVVMIDYAERRVQHALTNYLDKRLARKFNLS